MEWTGDSFTLDGITFGEGGMLVCKPRDLIDRYVHMLKAEQPRRIVELGIYRGGSATLIAQLAKPEKLVAVDLEGKCPPLDRAIAEHNLPIVPYYGVDQSDRGRLARIVDTEFDGPLDLVVDDASHLLDPTRASFHELFPRLRPGGLYVIEDWGWQHIRREPVVDRPLSVLVCEIVMSAATRRKAIAGVAVDEHWTAVRRGPAELTPGRFDLALNATDLTRDMMSRLASSPVAGAFVES